MEKVLGHLFITSSSSHFFTTADFQQYVFNFLCRKATLTLSSLYQSMLGRGFPVALHTKATVPLTIPTTETGGPTIVGAAAKDRTVKQKHNTKNYRLA